MAELEDGTEVRGTETDYDPVVSLSLKYVDLILGDTLTQEMRKGQSLIYAPLENMVMKGEICQHQERSEMRKAEQMGWHQTCSGCHGFLLSGLIDPTIKETKQNVKQPSKAVV